MVLGSTSTSWHQCPENKLKRKKSSNLVILCPRFTLFKLAGVNRSTKVPSNIKELPAKRKRTKLINTKKGMTS